MLSSLKNMEPWLLGVILGGVVILLFAFFMGMSKGFKRVSKGGFYWAIAGTAFIFLYKALAEKNKLADLLTGKAAKFSNFAWALALVIGCILATIILVAAIGALFRPSTEKSVRLEDDDYEYDEDDMDRPVYRSRGGRSRKNPGIVSRLFGGITCILNLCIILAVIAVLALVLLQDTSIGGKLSMVYDVEIVGKIMPFASKYILDFVTVGIIYAVAIKGFNTGFVGTTRILISRLGMLAALVLGFAIPFVDTFNTIGVITTLVDKFAGMLTVLGGYAELGGRVLTGAVIALIGIILVAILSIILKKLTYNIDETTVIRVVDGALATVVYLALGALLCVAFWALLYVCNYVGLFNVSGIFGEGASFAKECYALAEEFLQGTLDKYLAKYL